MSDQRDPSFRVTIRDVYTELGVVRGLVAAVQQQLAVFTSEITSERKRIDDHEARIRKVEMWAYGLAGTMVLAFLTFFLTR